MTGSTSLVGLLSLTTPNVLDYGYFSTASIAIAPPNATYTAQVPTTAYIVVPGGVTIVNDGIYLVQYWANLQTGPVTLALELAGAIVAGTVMSANNFLGPISGTALVIASAGETLKINSLSDLVVYDPLSNSAAFSIVRVR